jgi:hypothetical protein
MYVCMYVCMLPDQLVRKTHARLEEIEACVHVCVYIHKCVYMYVHVRCMLSGGDRGVCLCVYVFLCV